MSVGTSRARQRTRGLALVATAGVLLLMLGLLSGKASGSQPFSPQLAVRLWDPNPAAATSVIAVTWVSSGSHTLGTWSLDLPTGWDITRGTSVPEGDIVAEATMSVDVDCNGSIQEFGPFTLVNQPMDPTAVADWTGTIAPWWWLTVSADGSAQEGYDLSADLTTITEAHTFCAPQVFALTLFGHSVAANVQLLTNPGQGNHTFTMFGVSRGGEHATQDTDSVTVAPTALPTTDIDGDGVTDELPCAGDPSNSSLRPERTDAVFAGIDDNGNGLIDEMPPPGASNYDCDGDGYKLGVEWHVFDSVRADQDACGTDAWASDITSGGAPDSTDRITLNDLTSFMAPVRRLDTSPGDSGFDVRWDLAPGAGALSTVVNLSDLTVLFAGAADTPPMLGGARALNGPLCPWGDGPQPTPTPSPTATPGATPTPTPTAAPTPTPSPPPNGDTDGDGVIDEAACGSDPLNPARRPERLDGVFGGQDDDGDTLIDEALPAGSGSSDCDGDGYVGSTEDHVFGASTSRDQDPCGVDAWPSDFVSGGAPDSTNRINLGDLTSFLAPTRRLDTSPGDAGYDVRWDLSPGAGALTEVINLSDLTTLLVGSPGAPPMLLGARAFNGPACPWAP